MTAKPIVKAEETDLYPDDIDLYPEEIELIEDESQAPDTDDIEEIRRYWDTHAVTDWNSEPVPREEWPVKSPTTIYSVHIEREHMYKLADLAEAEGILTVPMAQKLLRRAISEAHAAKFGASASAPDKRQRAERASRESE